ncbi:fatty acid desaturase [Paracoccaceae bacterium]|nr:fatty acid desaturase [Paracoccaceae bacterium]
MAHESAKVRASRFEFCCSITAFRYSSFVWHLANEHDRRAANLGMANKVTDHRLNTRTVMMGPINRFLYLNMNYHVEHHMFTMIPYYKLPAIRELIKQDLPEAEPGIFAAYKRLLPLLWEQLADNKAVIVYDLPKNAVSYRDEVKYLLPH